MSRRKSVEHHKVMGTYRADRHRPALAFPKGASCPSWLTNQAKREWRRVAPLLEAQNILQKSDTMILAAYCEAFANWRDAVKHVEAEGAIIQYESTTRTGRTSKPIRNPWVQLALDYQKAMLTAASKFGLDPLARSRWDAPVFNPDEGQDGEGQSSTPVFGTGTRTEDFQ